MNNKRVIVMIIASCLFVVVAVGKQSPALLQDHPGDDSAAGETDTDTTSHVESDKNAVMHGSQDVNHDVDSNNSGGGHGGSRETELADALAVDEPPAWFVYVTGGFAVLFIAAIFLGSAAVIIKGPDPPDPASEHHH